MRIMLLMNAPYVHIEPTMGDRCKNLYRNNCPLLLVHFFMVIGKCAVICKFLSISLWNIDITITINLTIDIS